MADEEDSIHEDLDKALDGLDREEIIDLIEYILYLESGADIELKVREKEKYGNIKDLKTLEYEFFNNVRDIKSLKKQMRREHRPDLRLLIKFYREYESYLNNDKYEYAERYINKLVKKSKNVLEICENVIYFQEELESLTKLSSYDTSSVDNLIDEIIVETEMANYHKALEESVKLDDLIEKLKVKKRILINYESSSDEISERLEEAEKTGLPIEPINDIIDRAEYLKDGGRYREAVRALNRADKKIDILFKIYELLHDINIKIEELENYDEIKDYEKKLDKIREFIRNNRHIASLKKAKRLESRLKDEKEISIVEKKEKKKLDRKPDETEETYEDLVEVDGSDLVSPVYSFLVPAFLMFYVGFEFLSALILYPLVSPSKVSLYVSPVTFFVGENISTLTISFCIVIALFIATLLSFDFETRKLSIDRRRIIVSLMISAVIALSLGTYMYTMPSSVFRLHHYLIFFLSIVLVATKLDLILNHDKFLKRGKDGDKGRNKEDKKECCKDIPEKKEESLINRLKSFIAPKEIKNIFSIKTSPRIFVVILLTVLIFGSAITSGYYNDNPLDDKKSGGNNKDVENENITSRKEQKDNPTNELMESSTNDLKSSSSSSDSVNLTELMSGNADNPDRFGWNVSTGNLNGDKYKDIIVGAPYNDSSDGSILDSGAVYIYFGYRNISNGNLDPGNANVSIYGTSSEGHFGWDVGCAGDIDNDGFEDLVIGEPDNGSGAAYVFLGKETWSSNYNSGDYNISILGTGNDERLGLSVAGVGDKENDGYEDLAVGSPFYDGRSTDEGCVYLFGGGDSFNEVYLSDDPYIKTLNGPKNETMNFGFSIAEAGDLNGDDYDDMVVGAPEADESYVYYGDDEGYLIKEMNTTVSDFESGDFYRTKVVSNSTTPPDNNADVILKNRTVSSGLEDIDNSGTIFNEDESTGSFKDTLEKDGDMWNIKETGSPVNVTADSETTVNGTTINDYRKTYQSDDDYEILKEDETKNYSLSNFEGDESGWTTSGLWHRVDESQTYGDSHSPTHSFWYGQDSTGNYDTGSANSGVLQSPTYDLTYASSPKLEFYHWYETENYLGEYDICEVIVNGDVVYHRDSEDQNVGSENNFVKETIDLSSYIGQVIDVQFVFDTVDAEYNDHRGWYIDDVNITGLSTTSTLEHKWQFPVPRSSEVIFNLEAYHTDNGASENFTFYYSTTGSGYVGTSDWTEMLTVTNTSDDDYNLTFTSDTLNNTHGNIYVGVIDTDRELGNNATDSLYIDRMWFRCSNTSSYYNVNFNFDNLGSSYKRKTTLSFFGYEENHECNVTVWNHTSEQWVEIDDINVGGSSDWYNSSFNLTEFISGGGLVIRLNKSEDENPDAWIHIDYIGLVFDPYINNGTYYSAVTEIGHDIRFAKIDWGVSNYVENPSNLNISVSVDGGLVWEEVKTKGRQIRFKDPGNELMYKCEFNLRNKDYSPKLNWLTLSYQNRYTLLEGDRFTDFGWDVDGGENVDGDGYDDLLVGSPVNNGRSVTNLYYEGFEGVNDPTFNDFGWNVEDGYRDGETWELLNSSSQEVENPHNGYVAEVNSDEAGYVDMNENISTPSIDCTRYESVTLEFWHTYDYYAYYVNYGEVQISNDSGNTWNTIVTFNSDDSGWKSYDISQYANNQSNLKIRFHYVAYYAYEWTVDDVYINGTYEYPQGRAYLFEGSSSGVEQVDGKGTADTVYTGSESGNKFGYSISMGDLGADGYSDVYIGEPYNDTEEGSVTDAGAIYMFEGSSSVSSNERIDEAQAYYGKSIEAYTGWSVSYLGKIGDTKGVAVGKPGWSSWYGNVTVLGKEREVYINYRALYQGGQNVTQMDVDVYNSSYHALNVVLNLTAEMGWNDDFESINITSWVDNGNVGSNSNYPELDYPNTRWNLYYDGNQWNLSSYHPNNEIMLQSTLMNYQEGNVRNWTLSLYLGNQTRHTINNGSGGVWNELSTSDTWDMHFNVTVNKGYGIQAYNEYGISKFCSVFYSGEKLIAEGAPNTTVYPSIDGAGGDPTIYYSANYDYNLTVYPTNYLERYDGERIGLKNVEVYTDELGTWVNMTKGALGKASPSEINLYGAVQSAPQDGNKKNITIDWRVFIPPGTPAGNYNSDQITYQIYIHEA